MKQKIISATRNGVTVEYNGGGWNCGTKTIKFVGLAGKLRRAAVDAKITNKINWVNGTLYNDTGSFRKCDGTISRRLAWKYCIGTRLSKYAERMLKLAIKKAFKKSKVEHVFIYNYGHGYSGDIHVYLREKVCKC